MLRWFPRLKVATTCFSCSPPDLNSVVTNFIFCIHVKESLPPGDNPIAVNKYYYYNWQNNNPPTWNTLTCAGSWQLLMAIKKLAARTVFIPIHLIGPKKLLTLLLLLLLLLLLYDMDVSCHRPIPPGTSLEPAVIPTAQASSFSLQYFPYYVWCSKYSCLL